MVDVKKTILTNLSKIKTLDIEFENISFVVRERKRKYQFLFFFQNS